MNKLVCLGIAAFLWSAVTQAGIIVPEANGTDGSLIVPAGTTNVIDLALAISTNWNSAVTSGEGVYDSNKWAVVFKYTDVNIGANAVVKFKNHPSRAPVVWLVSGDVTIDGSISLNGGSDRYDGRLSQPGPGGFRGGLGDLGSASSIQGGRGFGIGGSSWHTGGSYAEQGDSYHGVGPVYGNPSLIPLIGGSGGGGDENTNVSGGAGGGAILIAVEGTISCDGSIQAKGGNGASWSDRATGGGSGGGIRLVCTELQGSGELNVNGGGGFRSGGNGYIRLEREINNNSLLLVPALFNPVGLSSNDVAQIWPPAGGPEIRIVSIGGEPVPNDPRADMGTGGADITLSATNATEVVVETKNVEAGSTVNIRINPKFTHHYTQHQASIVATNATSPDLILTWAADLPVFDGFSAIQVQVVRP